MRAKEAVVAATKFMAPSVWRTGEAEEAVMADTFLSPSVTSNVSKSVCFETTIVYLSDADTEANGNTLIATYLVLQTEAEVSKEATIGLTEALIPCPLSPNVLYYPYLKLLLDKIPAVGAPNPL